MAIITELFTSVANKKVSPPFYPDHPYGPDELQVSIIVCLSVCLSLSICVSLCVCLCVSLCVCV